ncbi:MAG: hypothetical protein EP343_04485 [Deltaproteobacteria bacterium]|nr:MAG: hypothetical protein EP343_04485 [Deltaproteobacteria bacterium]
MSEQGSQKESSFRWWVATFIALLAAGGGFAGWGHLVDMFRGDPQPATASGSCIIRVKSNHNKISVHKDGKYRFLLGQLRTQENVQAVGRKFLRDVYRTIDSCKAKAMNVGQGGTVLLKRSQTVVATQDPNVFSVGKGTTKSQVKLDSQQMKTCLQPVGDVYLVSYRDEVGTVEARYMEPFSGPCHTLPKK